MFVDLKFSTVRAHVNAYWNPVSVADFHFVKP